MEQKERRSRSVFHYLILFFNIGAAVILLISQLAPHISPAKSWPLEFIAIAYPIILFINILFVVYWGARKNKLVFISAAVILMGYDKLSLLYQPALFSVDVIAPDSSIKLMSYNVRLFDLYNWSGNLKTRAKIFNLIRKENPKILCIQEYYQNDSGTFRNNDSIKHILNGAHVHTSYGVTLRTTEHWGLATFSQFPVVGKGIVFFTKGQANLGMYTDVLYRGDTIRIYNVHLQSNHLDAKDYRFIENPDSGSDEEIMNNVKRITRRMKKAVVKRSIQVDELVSHMASSPYPVILCGDFNDPPFSYAYHSLADNMVDAFIECGKGFGSTFTSAFAPYRIDFILHQRRFTTNRFQKLEGKYSDHYPIVAWLTLKKKQT